MAVIKKFYAPVIFYKNNHFYTVYVVFTSVNIVFTAVISHTVHGLNC